MGWGLQPADDVGRVAGDDCMRRDIAGDDAACTDDRAFADGDSGEDRYIATEPDIVPDGDGQGLLGALVALFHVKGVDSGEQVAAGTDEDVGADGDGGLVENRHVEVDIGVVAYGDLGAVVAVEGGQDYYISPHVSYERAQQDVSCGCLPGVQAVEFKYLITAGRQLCKQLGIT